MPRTKTPINRNPQPTSSGTVGSLIRIRRRELNISQKDLAAKLGISPVMLSNYENGTTSIRADDLPSFAHALGVHSTYFFLNDVFYPVYDEHGNELEELAEPELIPNATLRYGALSDEELNSLLGVYGKQLTKSGKRQLVRIAQALIQDELDEAYRTHMKGIVELAVQTPNAPLQ